MFFFVHHHGFVKGSLPRSYVWAISGLLLCSRFILGNWPRPIAEAERGEPRPTGEPGADEVGLLAGEPRPTGEP